MTYCKQYCQKIKSLKVKLHIIGDFENISESASTVKYLRWVKVVFKFLYFRSIFLARLYACVNK